LITYNSLYRGSSTLSLVDLISGLYVYLNRLDDINMQDSNTNNNIIYTKSTILNIFDDLITYNSLYRGSSTLSLVDLISGLYVYLNRLDDINMQDSNTNNNIIYTKSTILNIFDAYQIYIVD